MEITENLINDLKAVSKKIGYFNGSKANTYISFKGWELLFENHTLANDFTLELLEDTEFGSYWIDTEGTNYLDYWFVKRVIVDWLSGRYNGELEDKKFSKHSGIDSL